VIQSGDLFGTAKAVPFHNPAGGLSQR